MDGPDLNNYHCICLPLIGLLSEEQAALLENYVSLGGILIAFSRFATLNVNGWVHFDLPLPGLSKIFGIESIEADTLGNQQIEFLEDIFEGEMNRDLLNITDKTEVLARFTDGNPAVTLARLGEGFGVYISTQADIGYLNDPSHNILGEIIREINQLKNFQPYFKITGEFSRSKGIDPHILETEKKTIILFSNYLDSTKSGEFIMKLRGRKPVEIIQVFPDKNPVTFIIQGDNLSIPLEFGEKEVVILELSWKD